MSWYYRTLFQWEYNGIKDYLLISILWSPRFPRSVSKLLKLEWWMGNENVNFFGLIVDNAGNSFLGDLQNPNYFFSFSTLRISYCPHFPLSPISTPLTPLPSPPLPWWKKKTFLLPCPHDSGKSSIPCYSYCGLWSSGINIINGSFSSINCWLHLGRIELSVIPANIWFSRKRVPTRITEYSENQLFSSPQIFGSSCYLRYLFMSFFFLRMAYRLIYKLNLDSLVLKNTTMTYRPQDLFLLDAKKQRFSVFQIDTIAIIHWKDFQEKWKWLILQDNERRPFCCINYVQLITVNVNGSGP